MDPAHHCARPPGTAPLRMRSATHKRRGLCARHPEGTLSYCTCAQEAVSTKRRKKFGSSVAHKTIGTFLSQVRREDASGLATEQAKFSNSAAVRH